MTPRSADAPLTSTTSDGFVILTRDSIVGVFPGQPDEVVVDLHGLRTLVRRIAGVRGNPAEADDTFSPPAHALAELDDQLTLVVPIVTTVSATGFDVLDHDGSVVDRLTPDELWIAAQFRGESSIAAALRAHRASAGERSLKEHTFRSLAGRLRKAGLLTPADAPGAEPSSMDGRQVSSVRRVMGLISAAADATDAMLTTAAPVELASLAPNGQPRIPVVPMSPQGFPILSLGMLMASAMSSNQGELAASLWFVPDWMHRTIPTGSLGNRAAVWLFSNYIWSHRDNLRISASIKTSDGRHLTIHGGPDTPKYEADSREYLIANPHVDIIVHGEGEATIVELLKAIADSSPAGTPSQVDPDALRDVAGISFRSGATILRTADRERIADIESLPSPYLTGLFDSVGIGGINHGIIETNRGCPYGCTFCDWGSATNSRIRRFSLDRVFAELEWCAVHQVNSIYVADANFGIFERDVEIAAKVVELKERYGYPKVFGTNYAKNTVKHLRPIIELLARAGITTEGLLSLQSTDPNTLLTIRRSNIKTEKYEALAEEFRQSELPLRTDIMLGLPGSTRASFRNDLQGCVDREIRARVFPTQLLVNSPMNEPAYRAEHKIETLVPISESWKQSTERQATTAFVVASSTFTRDDFEHMRHLRQVYMLLDNYGVLRFVSRYVRHETGVRELDFYAELDETSAADPQRWPTVAFALSHLRKLLVPPVSWRLFNDEVRTFVVEQYGVPDDAAMTSAFRVQHALQPSRGRTFPMSIHLPHDYATWHHHMMEQKREGSAETWTERVAPLRTYPPADFAVDDPQDVCNRGLGAHLEFDPEADWEFASSVGQPLTGRHLRV